MNTVTLPAYAKINLTLDILRRREDGYHDLSMVMHTISLHDDVSVTLREDEGIVCRCGAIPGDESNLAVRAARAFFTQTGIAAHGLQIDITKRIPAQAGMAGGSADAAAVLHALSRLLAPQMSVRELQAIGALVGSDVPFCVHGAAALAEGRGERLSDLPPLPQCRIVVCKPDFPISTPELFSRVRVDALKDRPDTAGMIEALTRGDLDGVCARVGNVFEQVLSEAQGEVFTIRDSLHEMGALCAAMTGSGPTVFGIFRDAKAAERAEQTLKERYRQTFLTEPV